MKKRSHCIILILVIGMLVASGGCKGKSGSGKESVDSYAVLPETTKVLDYSTLNNFESASEDFSMMTFSGWTPMLHSLDNGDVIAAGIEANIPRGMLRKVSGIYENGSQVVLETEQASLDEAVQEGKVSMSTLLESGTIDSSFIQRGISMKNSIIPGLQHGLNISFAGVEIIPGVYVNGDIAFDIDLTFNLEISDFTVERFDFLTDTEFDSDLEFTSSGDNHIEHMVEVGRITFAPIEIVIGTLPVVFVPVLALNVGMDGDVSVNLVAEAHQNATLETGVSYYDDSWHEIKEFTSDFDFETPTIEGAARVKGYLGPQFSILLYGIAGPYASLNGYIEIDSTMIESQPWWGFYAGMDLSVGVDIEVCGKNIVDYPLAKLIEYRRPLASGRGDQNMNWSVESLEQVGTYGESYAKYAKWCDIAVDSNSQPHIAFIKKVPVDSDYDFYRDLKYARWNGSEWVFESLVNGENIDLYPETSIAIDAAGFPHILYSYTYEEDESIVCKLDHVYLNGSTWVTETISTLTDETFHHYRIRIGTDNIPQIVYCQELPEHDEMRYATRIGGVWNETLVRSDIINSGTGYRSHVSLDLVLDSHNSPHLAYMGLFEGFEDLAIIYAAKNAQSWDAFDFAALFDESPCYMYSTNHPRISLDNADRPYMADMHSCQYSNVSDGEWSSLQAFDEPIDVSIPGNGALLNSSAGRPMIVYEYYNDDTSATYVKYAYETDEGWIRENIDLAPDTGLDIEAARDSSDRVHSVYLDNTSGILKYAKRIAP